MSATPQDVQAKLDAAITALEQTTVGYKNKNWKTPPPGSEWAIGLAAIAAARAEAGQLVAPPTPTPPPVPPPTPSGDWAWGAQVATVDPNSAALIAAFLGYAFGHSPYFYASVATADADSASPAYPIPGGNLDALVTIPLGTQPGTNSDHHLTVRDTATGREHDLWEAKYDSSTQRITGCSGGASFPLGAVQEVAPGNANAAGFPLRRGLVTLADLTAGVIEHPLVFSMFNVGPPPARFPAESSEGYPSQTGFPLGTWLRLDPAYAVTGLRPLETMLCKALQTFGMFCRDDAGSYSELAIYAADDGGGGKTMAQWEAAVPGLYDDQGCPAYQLQGMPWQHMQVLVAPTS